MKLKTLIFAGLFLLGIGGISNAQTQINNGGFENWDNFGTDNVEPTNWNSFMTADAGFPMSLGKAKRVDRSTVKRPGSTGTYSAVIWSTSTMSVIANGNLTTGKVNMGSFPPGNSANYNFTKRSDANHYHAFTSHPDSIVFWTKFKPSSNGTEQARVHAVIHDNYDLRDPADGGSAPYIVGDATLNFSKTNGLWVRKSVPFVYSGPASTPAYILISLTTNMTPGGGSAGDSLYIDDMMVIYNPTLTTGTIATSEYYVSNLQAASISIPFTLTGTMYTGNVVTAQLSDAAGSFAAPVTLGTLTTTTSGTITGTIPAGTITGSGYRVRVVSSDYALTAADNGSDLQIYLASNSVSPAALQTIEAGSTGTAMAVSEVGTATSREWKYSTTTGGPYASFSTAETGTTFTPSFSTYGTYFVVCESNFPAGITATSSEVQIDVVDNVIAPATTQNIDMTVAGTQVDVTEYPVGTSREWLFATISGGPYASFSPTETALSYIPLFNTAGTYYVICQSTINGIPVTSGEVQIIVTDVTGIPTNNSGDVNVYFSENALVADLQKSTLINPTLQLFNMNGQFVAEFDLQDNAVNRFELNVPAGLYMYRIGNSEENISGKILKN
jgi:hypothetical protein